MGLNYLCSASFVLVIALCLWIQHTESKFAIHPKTFQIIDENGREVYFHGVNVYLGSSPMENTFSKEEMKRVAELGLNAVRLAFNWQGLEPVRGQYNMTYVQLLHKLLHEMNEFGLYALLDAHQDCLSPKFCGDGVPDWAAVPRSNAAPFPEPIDMKFELDNITGYPSRNDCAKHYWGLYCVSEAGASAVQNFYDNYNGVLDAFCDWWQFMAKQFRNYTNLLGYEILNEPFAGDIFYNPRLLLPSVADVENLMPMYHKVSKAIREVDTDTLVFFEPVTWSDFGAHFPTVPGGDQYRNKSVLSYHYYIPPNTIQSNYFLMRVEDSQKLQCGSMLTEFDAMLTTEDNMKQIAETITICNKYKISWLAWTRTGYLDDYRITTLLSQTYAMAVSGRVLDQSFDPQTSTYRLTYIPSNNCKLPTVIYLNEDRYYPNGYKVEIVPNLAGKWIRLKKNIVHIITSDNANSHVIQLDRKSVV